MSELRITIRRERLACGFGHVLPPWWPRVVLRWADSGSRGNGRVTACLRHTRLAWRMLGGRS